MTQDDNVTSGSDTPGPERIPAREVARLLGLSKPTVELWGRRGMNGFPPCARYGDAGWFFDPVAVRAWRADREREGAPQSEDGAAPPGAKP